MHKVPILEFDPEPQAIIDPARIIEHRDLPERCVLCFFREVLGKLAALYPTSDLPPMKSEMMPIPVSVVTVDGRAVGVIQAPVGAPLAANVLEAAIARGGRRFVACGGAGVLDRSIGSGELTVPTAALRDEGTSYHYLPPGRTVEPSPEAVNAIVSVLTERGYPFQCGMTWTTDAFYRETPAKISRRRAEGCLTVDMEAAAFFAVAQFRGVAFGQILYGGDDISGKQWDRRNLGTNIPIREALLGLAIEACLRL